MWFAFEEAVLTLLRGSRGLIQLLFADGAALDRRHLKRVARANLNRTTDRAE
jgi:hypothetical protein